MNLFHIFRVICTLFFSVIIMYPAITATATEPPKTSAQTQADGDWVRIQNSVPQYGELGEPRGEELGPEVETDIVVVLNPRNKEALEALSDHMVTGLSSDRLRHEDVMQRFAPTEKEANLVADYLRSHGFYNVAVATNRMLISAEGTAGMVKNAFKTGMTVYKKKGELRYANIEPASVPRNLSDIVSAVIGLQTVVRDEVTYRLRRPPSGTGIPDRSATLRQLGATKDRTDNPDADEATDIPKEHHMTEFASIYNAHNLPPAMNTTLGIITQGDIRQTQTDLDRFAAVSGFPKPTVRVIHIGRPHPGTEDLMEWNMDTQAALAAAGGRLKEMLLYNAGSLNHTHMLRAINQAVSDNQANVISASLGSCEIVAASTGYADAANTLFQLGIVQGQTFVFSTGDTERNTCSTMADAQLYPATSPYVIAIGGTTLLTTPRNTWKKEIAWNFSGGGPSVNQLVPSWQIVSGALPGTSQVRSVPDLSFSADPESGAQVLFKDNYEVIGGTSLAAPLFAGFWARMQSADNNQLPFPVTLLYMGAKLNPHWFNDVTTGNNGTYQAGSGWDYASGFGSLNVAEFEAAFRRQPPFQPDAIFLAHGIPLQDISIPKGMSGNYCFRTPTNPMQLYNNYYHPKKKVSLTFSAQVESPGGGRMFIPAEMVTGNYRNVSRSGKDKTGNSLTFHDVDTGVFCVRMQAATAAIEKFSITATFEGGIIPDVLTPATPVTNIALYRDRSRVFKIHVPPDKKNLHVKLTGKGDGDLYVSWGKAPNAVDYDRASFNKGSDESISISDPKAGTWYIVVDANLRVRNAQLVANYD